MSVRFITRRRCFSKGWRVRTFVKRSAVLSSVGTYLTVTSPDLSASQLAHLAIDVPDDHPLSYFAGTMRELHLLVYGKFLRTLDDKKGGWGHYWMTAEQLRVQEKISDDVRKEARDAYRAAEDELWAEGE